MKRINFSFLLMFLLCIGLWGRGYAQDIRVSAKLDKSSILMGDQTVLHLSAELPSGAQLSFPLLADTLSARVQIVSAGKTDTLTDQNKPGMRVLSKSYVITSFDAGLQAVPSLVFESDGKSYATEALPLEVKGVAVDTTKAIYDIKQPLAVSYTFMDWLRDNWPLVIAGLAVLLVLPGLWYYFKKIRKPKPAVEKAAQPVPVHVTALEQLQSLRDRKLWQQGEVKTYYIELTGIIRTYLEKRYLINAQEQTSDEILAALKGVQLTAENRNSLRELLVLADLVKFAKVQPSGPENEESIERAVGFVTKTRELERSAENKVQENNGVV